MRSALGIPTAGSWAPRLCQHVDSCCHWARNLLFAESVQTTLQLADICHWVACMLLSKRRPKDALEWFQRALHFRETNLGEHHLDTLSTVGHAAHIYGLLPNYASASERYRQALSGHEKTLGRRNPIALKLLNSMGWLYYYQGDYGPAREMYEEALSGQIDHLGIEKLDTLKTLQDLSVLEAKSGNYQKTIECFRSTHRHTMHKWGPSILRPYAPCPSWSNNTKTKLSTLKRSRSNSESFHCPRNYLAKIHIHWTKFMT